MFGNWELGIGNWVWGMGHRASGIGASGHLLYQFRLYRQVIVDC